MLRGQGQVFAPSKPAFPTSWWGMATSSIFNEGKLTMKISNLPAWARWMAMDEDGHWWCYEAEPHRHDRGWYENEVGRSQKINLEQNQNKNWQQSLYKVNT